jgi:hypothetical protein
MTKRKAPDWGITRTLWQFLLEHGGHWTSSELAEQFGKDSGNVDRLMRSMQRFGRVTAYRSAHRKNGTAYGVTTRNRMPQCMTVEQVLSAVGVRNVIDGKGTAANDAKRTAA